LGTWYFEIAAAERIVISNLTDSRALMKNPPKVRSKKEKESKCIYLFFN
jgi:hypothetical protein